MSAAKQAINTFQARHFFFGCWGKHNLVKNNIRIKSTVSRFKTIYFFKYFKKIKIIVLQYSALVRKKILELNTSGTLSFFCSENKLKLM